MTKYDTSEVNFSLKGFASIQIGIYILIAAYLIKQLLSGFLIDDNFVGTLSIELIEYAVIGIVFFTFLFSFFALYFKGRRKSKKFKYKLWNTRTKKSFWLSIFGFILMFLVLFFLKNESFINLITPSFLLLYGLFIFLNKQKKRKDLLVFSLICLGLAVISALIPSYWYSSLFILGLAHIAYGVVVK